MQARPRQAPGVSPQAPELTWPTATRPDTATKMATPNAPPSWRMVLKVPDALRWTAAPPSSGRRFASPGPATATRSRR